MEADDEGEKCLICFDGNAYCENAIVFCDSCGISVHQSCYGITSLPNADEPWFCAPCAANEPVEDIRCALCLHKGGAFKPVRENPENRSKIQFSSKWCHVVCANWLPEVEYGDLNAIEPVILDNLYPKRKSLKCNLCQLKGICIQCNYGSCARAFHPWCALRAAPKIVETGIMANGALAAYCKMHIPKERDEILSIKDLDLKGVVETTQRFCEISSREQCKHCKMFVLSELLPFHINNCPKRLSSKQMEKSKWDRRKSLGAFIECRICGSSVLQQDISNHFKSCTAVALRKQKRSKCSPSGSNRRTHRKSMSPMQESDAEDRLESCSNGELNDVIEIGTLLDVVFKNYFCKLEDKDYKDLQRLFDFNISTDEMQRAGFSKALAAPWECSSTSVKSNNGATTQLKQFLPRWTTAKCSDSEERSFFEPVIEISSMLSENDPENESHNYLQTEDLEREDRTVTVKFSTPGESATVVQFKCAIKESGDVLSNNTSLDWKKYSPNLLCSMNSVPDKSLVKKVSVLMSCWETLEEERKETDNSVIDIDEVSLLLQKETDLLHVQSLKNTWVGSEVISSSKIESEREIESLVSIANAEMNYIRYCVFNRVIGSLSVGLLDRKKLNQNNDDGACVICFNGTSSSTNSIIFCDFCNIPVHQACYGISSVPKGSFFCDRCAEHRDNLGLTVPLVDLKCMLCPVRGGAFKKTANGLWIHVFCALWCEGVSIGDLRSMSSIDVPLSAPAPPSKCSVCQNATGVTIKCADSTCSTEFHALCGWDSGYYSCVQKSGASERYIGEGKPEFPLKMYCAAHCPVGVSDDREFQKKVRMTLCPPKKLNLRKKRGPKKMISHETSFGTPGSSKPNNKRYSQTMPSKPKRGLERKRRKDTIQALPIDAYYPRKCAVCFIGPYTTTPTENEASVTVKLLQCDICKVWVHESKCGGSSMVKFEDGITKCHRCIIDVPHTGILDCAICPRRGGFFEEVKVDSLPKPNDSNDEKRTKSLWVHRFCLNSTPGNTKEEAIRWVKSGLEQGVFNNANKSCVVCSRASGYLVSCSKRSCGTFMHPLCAVLSGFYFEVEGSSGSSQRRRQYFCQTHGRKDMVYNVPTGTWMQVVDVKALEALRVSLERVRLLISLCQRRSKLKKHQYLHDVELFNATLNAIRYRSPTPHMREACSLLSFEKETLEKIERPKKPVVLERSMRAARPKVEKAPAKPRSLRLQQRQQLEIRSKKRSRPSRGTKRKLATVNAPPNRTSRVTRTSSTASDAIQPKAILSDKIISLASSWDPKVLEESMAGSLYELCPQLLEEFSD